VAKDAWDIMRTTHESTSKVRMSKLQLLTTKFENLRMKDDEYIQDFHMNILDIDIAFSALEENMTEEKLVRKILKSFPKKFDMKVTAIEEAQHIKNMKVEDLIRSLQTFDMNISDKSEKKNKSIVFVSNTNDNKQHIKNMKVEDLIRSLQTFDMNISDRSEKKNKSIVFVSNTNDKQIQCDMETDEGISLCYCTSWETIQ